MKFPTMLSPVTIKSRRSSSTFTKNQGFTLIELLMVIAVILILAGITFGISRGVQNAQARAKAKAELATIAQALEQFKSTYGDYPWVGATTSNTNANDLVRALTGWTTLDSSGLVDLDTSNGPKKSFLDPTKLGLSDFPATGEPGATLYFVDPWGNNYVYAYKTGASSSWDSFGYVLFSEGADGASETLPSNGVINQAWRDQTKSIDNIYAGE